MSLPEQQKTEAIREVALRHTALLDAAPSEAVIQRMWQKIDIAEHERARTEFVWLTRLLPAVLMRPGALWAAACAAALVLIVIVRTAWFSDEALAWEQEGRVVVAQTLRSRGSTQQLRFDDGSNIAMSPESELSIVSSSGTSFVTALRQGKARFSVTPGGPRRWVVDAGNVNVEVVGTVFTVERSAGGVVVSVERGVVMVRGAIDGGERRLTAGQQVRAPALPETATDADAKLGEPGTNPAVHVDLQAGEAESEPHADVRAISLDALDAALEGVDVLEDAPTSERSDKKDASAPAQASGEESRPNAPSGIDQLLERADRARSGGNGALALQLLEQVVQEADSSDPRRGMAALSYARLATDAAQVRRVLQLGLGAMPASLREPALARLVRVNHELGDAAAAQETARRYLREFPYGPRATEVRRWAALP